VTQLAFEPFAYDTVRADGCDQWLIERVPSAEINRRLDGWKLLQQAGWNVTVLIAPDSKTVVVLACK
jgi:hypothetical protein